MSAVLAINSREHIGANNPPEPTPFDLSASAIGDLVMEASNWLDGSGVQSEADAEAVSKLIDMLRKEIKTADERRVAENKPFDDGKAEVQARYAPLIADTKSAKGVAVIAIETAKKALAPWLMKVAADQKAIADAARLKAEEDAAAAVEAIRAARQGEPDLEARVAAEALLTQAKQSEADARRAESAKAHAKGGTRAIGLRSVWRGEVTDDTAFARWVWLNRNDVMQTFLADLAQREVHGGMREMAGVTITEEKVL